MTSCPSEDTLVRWASGALPAEEVSALATHVDGCEPCRVAFSAAVAALRIDDTIPARPSLLGPTAPVTPGQVLLRKYEVLELLGSGGMGVVFRARHLQLNHEVALKFIRGEHLHRADMRSRFSREARAAAALRSPYVNRVLDLGELEDGTPFMVLELLKGQTLEAVLARHGPLPELEVIRWSKQACAGLEAAHAAGIVHRDLKPANLFVRREGDTQTLTILDFGVARSVNPLIEAGLRQTTTPALVGSPAFMAPEQLSGAADIGPLVDVWAMGCTMQLLLTGRPAFVADDLIDLAWRVRNAQPSALPQTVSAPLSAIVARCLEKQPAARFSSAAALREALEAVSTTAPAAMKAPAKPSPWRWVALIVPVLLLAWVARPSDPPAPAPVLAPPKNATTAPAPPPPPPPPPISPPPPAPRATETSPPPAPKPTRLPTSVGRPAKPVVADAPPDAGDDVFGQRL